MNAGCRKKLGRLAANVGSRKRMIGALWKRPMPVMQTDEFKATLLQRYPTGLIEDAEIEALLNS